MDEDIERIFFLWFDEAAVIKPVWFLRPSIASYRVDYGRKEGLILFRIRGKKAPLPVLPL